MYKYDVQYCLHLRICENANIFNVFAGRHFQFSGSHAGVLYNAYTKQTNRGFTPHNADKVYTLSDVLECNLCRWVWTYIL